MTMIPIVDEQGNQIPNARIDPAILQFVMTAAQTNQILRLRKLQEAQIPTGLRSMKRGLTTEYTEIALDNPWISFSMINDGPDSISVEVNELDNNETEIKINETFNLDMKAPKIKKLYLKSISGTAAVRIYGKEGKNNV
jgi:hypothetical protein